MAKGITSAYSPLSATAVKEEIFQKFIGPGNDQHFRHVNTFGGNPVSCAVALKNLEIVEEEKLVERSERLGEQLRNKLDVLVNHPKVGDIRSFGFIIGIEMVKDQGSKIPLSNEKMVKILSECKKRGLIIGKNSDTVPSYNNVLTLCPPFVTTEDEIDLIVNILIETLDLL
jgi:adenosylmethionine-8-amino-7-oxononanoate aminotransferase